MDYTVPVDRVRKQLRRILEDSDLWDGKAWGLQVTGTTERSVELRALMGARNSGDAWNLRCEVREKLVGFLQGTYPDSLPRLRAELSRDGQPVPPERVGSRGTDPAKELTGDDR